jgi:hypothetical protein
MARRAKESDLMLGAYIHYWGKNYIVWANDGNNVLLVIPGQRPNSLYQPYPAGQYFSTSEFVNTQSEFLLCFN